MARVRGDHEPRTLQNTAIKAKLNFWKHFSPDSERLPGLPADLQKARATQIFLIWRDDDHNS
jgi:endonuclease YncB( thermonuclease family)